MLYMNYLDVTSKDRPTMEQLMKIMRIGHIDIVTKWHEFGLVLVDSYNVIKIIKADHRNDVTTCCRILFEKWLEKAPDASWNELVTALNGIEMKTAADFITKQFKSGSCAVQLVCNLNLGLRSNFLTFIPKVKELPAKG